MIMPVLESLVKLRIILEENCVEHITVLLYEAYNRRFDKKK